jgi:phenylacetic acid degradation operon negative regulatory protein
MLLPKELVLRKKLSKNWDGKWWIVIYDIPEKMRKKRNVFREWLKSLGFGKVKESCRISPYDFTSEIYNFCKKMNIFKIYMYV